MAELKYEIDENFNFVVEEKNNSFIAIRKVSWNGREPKLDVRKWYSNPDGEICGKGVSFSTEDGPHEMVHVLVKENYGDTATIMNALSHRDDFYDVLKTYLGDTLTEEQASFFQNIKENEFDSSEELYDPREDLDLFDDDVA